MSLRVCVLLGEKTQAMLPTPKQAKTNTTTPVQVRATSHPAAAAAAVVVEGQMLSRVPEWHTQRAAIENVAAAPPVDE